jgi:hypothetical protein
MANLKPSTEMHTTMNALHEVGGSFQLQYDGILGHDFWFWEMKTTIRMKFDARNNRKKDKFHRTNAKVRLEPREVNHLIQRPSLRTQRETKLQLWNAVYLYFISN